MKRRNVRSLYTALPIAALIAVVSALSVHAQERHSTYYDSSTPLSVVIGVKGGVVLTSARQQFPSVRIGDSYAGSGTISSSFGRTGLGSRYGLDILIPFTSRLGIVGDLAVQTSDVRLAADGSRPAVRFDLQAVQGGIGLQGNLYVDTSAFAGPGLRTVYLSGGPDIALGIIENRLEGYRVDSNNVMTPATGSFDNNDPFRTLVALRFAGGVRYGIGVHWELQGEASYAFALNSLFSSTVVRDNSFTFDNLGVMLGLGYRF
ncbi:MAG TPA: hypothetical protein VHI13_22215 [Candidatus Kapabacteria bacterium]|nr:hypothetical protein [Candidatus Kapabacteria bacterium]